MPNMRFLLVAMMVLVAIMAGFFAEMAVDSCFAEGASFEPDDLPTDDPPAIKAEAWSDFSGMGGDLQLSFPIWKGDLRIFADVGEGIGDSLSLSAGRIQIQATSGRFEIVFGHGNVRWGAGRYCTLILDDRAQFYPFILMSATAGTKFGKAEYSRLTGKLGPYPDTYILGQRLDLYPKSWLRLGVSEIAIADGRFASMLTNWIPLWPFYLTQHLAIHSGVPGINDASNENLGLDAAVMLRPGTILYGEFFVDDMPQRPENGGVYQVALLVGGTTELSRVLRLDAEYARANNYTYTFRNPARSYLNQGESLGFRLGPDADRLIVMLRRQFGKIEAGAGVELRRRGEGRIGDKWQDIGWQEARKRSFLYGVVEQTSLARAEVDWAFSPESRIKSGIAVGPVRNRDNVPGASDVKVEWTLGIEYNLSRIAGVLSSDLRERR